MVHFELDMNGGIDLESLIGEIVFSDGKDQIVFQITYVESILEAFLTGVIDVKTNDKATIELIEETGSLVFESYGAVMNITYRNHKLNFDKSLFINELKLATDRFLAQIEEALPGMKNKLINNIIELRNLL